MPTVPRSYHAEVLQTIRDAARYNKWFSAPLSLGGIAGEAGGSGVPVGGIYGQLIQTKVAYDTTELATPFTHSGGLESLVDNLNHIRWRLFSLEDVLPQSRYTITFEDVTDQVPGDTFTVANTPVSGSVMVHIDGVMQRPTYYVVDYDAKTITTDYTTVSGDEVLVEYLIDTGEPWAGLTIAEETTIKGSGVTALDFHGAFITVSGNAATIVITGSGLAAALDDLQDVVITSPGDNDLLAYDTGSSKWIDQTAAEAGLATTGHTHTESDITDLDHDAVSIRGIDVVTWPPTTSGQVLTYDGNVWGPETVSGVGGSHDPVTVQDTASVNLELTGQALSGYVIPGGVDHDQLLNFAANEHFTEGSIDHTNIQNIGTTSHADIDAHIASGYIHTPSGHIHDDRYYTETEVDALLHDSVTVVDTASLDLELTGQALSGYVIAGGIDHGELAGLADDDHTIYLTSGRADDWFFNQSHTNLQDIGTNTHAQIDTHIADTTIHFDELGELSDVSVGGATGGQALTYDGANWIPSGIAGGHNPVTVQDTASIDLELTDQALSGYVIPGGVDHDQLLNYAANEHFTESSIDHTNIQNIGTNTHAQLDAHVASGYIHTPSGHIHDDRYYTETEIDVWKHDAVSVVDTSTVNLELTGQALSGYVIPGGISHTEIADIGSNTHAQIDSHISDTTIHFDELGEVSDVTVGGASQGEVLTYDGADWIASGLGGIGHDPVTIQDTASINLELTDQALSGYVIPGGVDHDQLLNYAANEHFTESSIDHTNIQSIGTNTHDDIDAHIASGYIHTPSGHIHDDRYYTETEIDAKLHDAVTVVDTSSLNLELTGQALSGYVLDNSHSHVEANITDLDHDAVKLQGRNISSAAPADNYVLTWDAGSSWWEPAPPSGAAAAGDSWITEDVTSQVPDAGDDFWLSNSIASGTLAVYYNGLLQQPSNYIETSASGFHTYFSPVTNDELVAQYLVSDVSGGAVVGTIQVEEDDVVVQQRVAILNFEGSGVQDIVDEGSNKVTVTISGGGSGVTDHGALTGLADDDHTQYGHLSQDETVNAYWTFNRRAKFTNPETATDILTISGGYVHVTDAQTGFDSPLELRGNVVDILGNNAQELATFTPSEIAFNDPSNDVNFRVESDDLDDMFFIDAGTNKVYIGGQSGITDLSNTLGIQYRLSGQTLTSGIAGIAFGDLEGSNHYSTLQHLSYVTGGYHGAFSIWGLNQYWDESDDAWAQYDTNKEGVAMELWSRENTADAGYALFYTSSGVPGTFKYWITAEGDADGTEQAFVRINEGGHDIDFLVEGDTDEYLLFTDAGTDRVGIGLNDPQAKLHVDGTTVASGTLDVWDNLTMNDGQQIYFNGPAAGDHGYDNKAYTYRASNGPLITHNLVQNASSKVRMQWAMLTDTGKAGYITYTESTTQPDVIQFQIDPTASGVEIRSGGNFIRSKGVGDAGPLTETVFNEYGYSQDFRIEGDTDQELFFVDASTERVGIGTNTPQEKLHVDGDILSSGTAVMVTGTRPSLKLYDSDQTYTYSLVASGTTFNIEAHDPGFGADTGYTGMTLAVVDGPRFYRYVATGGNTPQASATFTTGKSGGTISDGYGSKAAFRTADDSGTLHWQGGLAYAQDFTNDRSEAQLMIKSGAADTYATTVVMNADYAETVFNDAGNDRDFRVAGDTESNLIFVDGGTDRVGFGTTAVSNAYFNFYSDRSGSNTVMRSVVEADEHSLYDFYHYTKNSVRDPNIQFRFYGAEGDSVVPSGIGSNAALGTFAFYGYHTDSASFQNGINIHFRTDEDWAAGSATEATYVDFHVTRDGTTSPTSFLRLSGASKATIVNWYNLSDVDFIARGDNNDVLKVDAANDFVILNSVKTTTGDPTGESGLLVINTNDNNVKIYADGGWRTLASW